jgi:hypothetical protein
VANSDAKSLAIDSVQKSLDTILQNPVLNEIPIIKSIVAISKTWQAVKDQLFLRKVTGFVLACPKFSESEKNKFLQEHSKSAEAMQQLGDALVLVLKRLDDLEKPAMLAKMFAAFVRGCIDYADFRGLAAGIGTAFVGDLKKICSNPLPPESKTDAFWGVLEPSGFAATGGGVSRIPTAIGTRTDITQLGRLFQKCMLEEQAK